MIYHYTSEDHNKFLIETNQSRLINDYIWAKVLYVYDIDCLLSNEGYFNCSRLRDPTEKELSDYYKVQVFK